MRVRLLVVFAFVLVALDRPAFAVCGDNVVELPAEQCDGTDDLTCPGQCQADCFCPLDHFQCYEVKRRVFTPIPVTVTDQFGTTAGSSVDRGEVFCAPADKNGEDPGAEDDPDFLAGYRFKHPFTKVRNQKIVNQFGTTFVDVLRPAWLFVPSSINLASPPPAIDHFQCYKVKRSRGTPKFIQISGVNVVDYLGSYTEILVKPRFLCAPANKNGEDPGAETHLEHLLCYKTRAPKLGGVTNQFVANQFGNQLGQQGFDLIRRVEFCVPSLKNPPDSTTTSTSTTSTSSTSSSTTSTTLYGSPSRAFIDRVASLLD